MKISDPVYFRNFKKCKPAVGTDLLVLTKNGEIYRAKYLIVAIARESRSHYDSLCSPRYIVDGNPEEVLIPHGKEFTPNSHLLMETAMYWSEIPQLPEEDK